jgi:hypothetical protein
MKTTRQLLLFGAAFLLPILACGGVSTPPPQEEPLTPEPPAAEPAALESPAIEVPAAATPLPTAGKPRIYDFEACLETCDGTNSRTSFPKRILSIQLAWKFENIPTGAHYVRDWSHEEFGSWVTYDCKWPGPPSGNVQTNLYDYDEGLTSGNWYVTISVDDETIFRERIFVEGNYKTWSPAGRFDTCY